MNIICSPLGIVDVAHPRQGIMDIAKAGFEDMVLDFSCFCDEKAFEDYAKQRKMQMIPREIIENPSKIHSFLALVLESCTENQLRKTLAYAPRLKRNAKQKVLQEPLVELTKECIIACEKAGCRYIVIRPLFIEVKHGEEWEANREYYLQFANLAREHHVKILLENQCKNINGHLVRGICSDGRSAAQWVDQLNEEAGQELFGFCMDVGVCNLCGQNMYDYILALGTRLKAVILRDCDGNKENALLPFTCSNQRQSQTDWLNLIRGLREIAFDGELVLNFADTAAAFSPILRPQLLELAKAIAEYFVWQIHIENLLRKNKSIVLFGAGNMCRNYMKCYGEQYPPMFTCDNNSAIWGTHFCGLEVKSPESLRDLPEDCVIFICNIYYRDIEKQIRDMGIQNTVEFFNDEYMPSFYFDRLENR